MAERGRIRGVGLLAGACLASLAGAALGGPPARTLAWDDYEDRLRGLWLAQCVANWTGLQTEGDRIVPPFYTDADWAPPYGAGTIDFILDLDPWPSDDDTDIEYVYVYLMEQSLAETGSVRLDAERIRDGWIEHINRFIWVSNQRARSLMNRGLRPPQTGLASSNVHRVKIDAQLTTEIFGAVYPGMVAEALEASELAIRTTANGHAAHAAQLFVAMHALAPVAPASMTLAEQCVWLVEESRRWIPDESKTADIVDVVLADYLANPDPTDWERTRDLVYQTFQLNASANGYTYRGWTESGVNLAGGLIALLYGQGDFKDTIRIGSLSGWDSDNGTASMAGLLGLLRGSAAVEAAFADHPGYPAGGLSDRYDIDRTRDNMPDHLPDDTEAQDTLTMLSARMMALVASAVRESGGAAEERGWIVLPPALPETLPGGLAPSEGVATTRLARRSANLTQRLMGSVPVGASNVNAAPTLGVPANAVGSPAYLRTGIEPNFLGTEQWDPDRRYYSSQNSGQVEGDELILSVTYSGEVQCKTIRFIEGDHFTLATHGLDGGWFTSLTPEVRIGGVWMAPPGGAEASEALDPAVPFQVIDFELPVPLLVTGVRVRGSVGPAGFATATELDAFDALSGPTHVRPAFDINGDGAFDIDDLHAITRAPVDLDGDGSADLEDARYLRFALETRQRSAPPPTLPPAPAPNP